MGTRTLSVKKDFRSDTNTRSHPDLRRKPSKPTSLSSVAKTQQSRLPPGAGTRVEGDSTKPPCRRVGRGQNPNKLAFRS